MQLGILSLLNHFDGVVKLNTLSLEWFNWIFQGLALLDTTDGQIST